MEISYRRPLKGGSLNTVRWFTPVPAHRLPNKGKEIMTTNPKAKNTIPSPKKAAEELFWKTILAGCPTLFPGFTKNGVKPA
ncbi:MAG: hypothetical protein WB421_05115 [Terriglobales bacterium]|jgi:hypothetical protein